MTKIKITEISGERGDLNRGWRQEWGGGVRNAVCRAMGRGRGRWETGQKVRGRVGAGFWRSW